MTVNVFHLALALDDKTKLSLLEELLICRRQMKFKLKDALQDIPLESFISKVDVKWTGLNEYGHMVTSPLGLVQAKELVDMYPEFHAPGYGPEAKIQACKHLRDLAVQYFELIKHLSWVE